MHIKKITITDITMIYKLTKYFALKKGKFIKIRGYHEKYQHAEDLDLFLRLAEIGELANLPDVLLQYRLTC